MTAPECGIGLRERVQATTGLRRGVQAMFALTVVLHAEARERSEAIRKATAELMARYRDGIDRCRELP